jgi:hypothetical protein
MSWTELRQNRDKRRAAVLAVAILWVQKQGTIRRSNICAVHLSGSNLCLAASHISWNGWCEIKFVIKLDWFCGS